MCGFFFFFSQSPVKLSNRARLNLCVFDMTLIEVNRATYTWINRARYKFKLDTVKQCKIIIIIIIIMCGNYACKLVFVQHL